jgi:chemotaxis protein methyltransferase CheR
MNSKLTDIEFTLICNSIASRMGLHFPIDRRDMLSHNLASAAREFGFKNMSDFVHWLLSTTLDKPQIEILASHLTNSETYFWREPQVFEAFSQNTLMELIDSKNDKEKIIKIWCAGCSTGEEAYSIAIALHRTIPNIKDWEITILATDINTKALAKARTGVYTSWSFRNSPSWFKSSYFKSQNNKEYIVNTEIKNMVTFSSFNLTSEKFFTSLGLNYKFDIIFCRNVLMYFTEGWADKIAHNLYNSLSEEGWLLVSSCELSSDLFPKLTPVNFPGAILYKKSKNNFSESKMPDSEANAWKFFKGLSSLPTGIKEVMQLFSATSIHEDLAIRDKNKTEAPFQTEIITKDIVKPKLLSKTQEDVLNENKLSIRSLADQGHLTEALSVCNSVIASDKLIPGLYFLKASILQEQNKCREAIKSLKQAIYIDPDYIMGHFTLGNLFIRQGIVKEANRYFTNALELLNVISDDEILKESEGLSPAYLRRIILDNLEAQ